MATADSPEAPNDCTNLRPSAEWLLRIALMAPLEPPAEDVSL